MTDNHIGKTLYIAQAVPAANTTAGFEALTWVQVKGVQTLPQFGITHSTIDVPDLASGYTSKIKGAATGVSTTGTCRLIPADAGQVDIEEQCLDQLGAVSFKIGKGSGADSGDGPALTTGDTVEYAQGVLHSFQPNQPNDSSHEGFSYTFEQNAPTVAGTEPAA